MTLMLLPARYLEGSSSNASGTILRSPPQVSIRSPPSSSWEHLQSRHPPGPSQAEHSLRVAPEYFLLVTLINFQPSHKSQRFRVFRDRVVGSEDHLVRTGREVDGFADLLGKPLRILLCIWTTRHQSGDVRVDLRVLVDELGHILKPWIAKVADDYCQLLPLVRQSIQCQRVRAGEVSGAECCVSCVEEHRETL